MAKVQADLIREHGEVLSSLNMRIDHAERDVAKVEASLSSVHDLDKGLAVITNRLESLEKKLDELQSRRWELWKIIVVALLGIGATGAAGVVGDWAKDWFGPQAAVRVARQQHHADDTLRPSTAKAKSGNSSTFQA